MSELDLCPVQQPFGGFGLVPLGFFAMASSFQIAFGNSSPRVTYHAIRDTLVPKRV